MIPSRRVVFDCNVYFQALIGPGGPAGQILSAAARGQLILYTSDLVLDEFRRVCSRPRLAQQFNLTVDHVLAFLRSIETFSLMMNSVPQVFTYERDPDDAHYVDLAVAAKASLIVSRDKDLLALQDPTNPGAIIFQRRFPGISVLTPTELLFRLASPETP